MVFHSPIDTRSQKPRNQRDVALLLLLLTTWVGPALAPQKKSIAYSEQTHYATYATKPHTEASKNMGKNQNNGTYFFTTAPGQGKHDTLRKSGSGSVA